jgi:hypothetical protein
VGLRLLHWSELYADLLRYGVTVKVAGTRIIQGSTLEVPGLSKGRHHFQCCIRTWMRVDVEVK